uniref:Uncharacterized protein n=1 Tax=Phenylobacterium glaciei TaxID=2803784 RepID=A0A974P6X2_9CAUL|nr:hypothetical protein JKL49_11230 [Phenylobacterium glaciei]
MAETVETQAGEPTPWQDGPYAAWLGAMGLIGAWALLAQPWAPARSRPAPPRPYP